MAGVAAPPEATPLAEVTFVVLDLETTGGSPHGCAITEVGALKFRGGECLGTFQTLVNPGLRLPPEVVYLTGITESMVAPAPMIDSVLPAFAEFIGDAVVVGHNVAFDLGFLRANLARLGYPPLTNRVLDTYTLARRLVRDEVPNYKLRTLARHFRTDADPCHRALDDARATAEVFHRLVERVGSIGITALDDLLALPKTAAHPQVAKLRWVAPLPRKPGVYLFRDVHDRVLYVGRAADLRRRVRSYFASDDRRKIGPLLREAQSLDHVVCANDLEAAALEVRLIRQHVPRYNRQVEQWQRYRYVKLTLDEHFPRLAVVRTPRRSDRCLYVGPLPSRAVARAVVAAIETAVPLRRCTGRIPARATGGEAPPARPCTGAKPGGAPCPCSGGVGRDAYTAAVARTVRGLTIDPALLLEPLRDRMVALTEARRFDEAAEVRDVAGTLTRSLARQRRLEALVLAGRIEVEVDGGGAVVDGGRLIATWEAPTGHDLPPAAPIEDRRPLPPPALPLGVDVVDEVAAVAAWLDARAGRLRLRSVEHGWAIPLRESTGRGRDSPIGRARTEA